MPEFLDLIGYMQTVAVIARHGKSDEREMLRNVQVVVG